MTAATTARAHHVEATLPDASYRWGAHCLTCGWIADGFSSITQAEAAGDEHVRGIGPAEPAELTKPTYLHVQPRDMVASSIPMLRDAAEPHREGVLLDLNGIWRGGWPYDGRWLLTDEMAAALQHSLEDARRERGTGDPL